MKILYLVNLNRNGNYSILLQCPGENEITEYKVEEDAKQKCCCIYGDKVTKLQIKMNEMEGKVFFIKERENKKYKNNVKELMEQSKMKHHIEEIGTSISKYEEFAHYVEALVAYHKFYGGND